MSKGTTHRSVRVEDELWETARALAAQNDETMSDIIRDALRRYIEDNRIWA